jgi:hypothetical protein
LFYHWEADQCVVLVIESSQYPDMTTHDINTSVIMEIDSCIEIRNANIMMHDECVTILLHVVKNNECCVTY